MTISATRTSRRGSAVVALAVGVALVAALFSVDFFAPSVFEQSLSVRAQDALTLAVSVLIEAMPFVLLGVMLAVLVQVWVPAGTLERLLPRRPVLRRLALSCLGMLIPVCECGNVPFARGLLQRGTSAADTLTFLVAAPIVNPIVIITTHAAFGWDDGILIARILGGLVIANVLGWIFSLYPDPERLLIDKFRQSCDIGDIDARPRVQRSLSQVIIELRAVMPALVIGSALAGLVQVVIPRSALVEIGSNPVLSILMMMLLAVTVAICSNVDSFFALSLAASFSPGSIVAFLLVGPVVDLKMLALMRTTFTTRTLVIITTVVLLSAFAIGTWVNLLV